MCTQACFPPAVGGVRRPGGALCEACACGQTRVQSVVMSVRAVRTPCRLQGMHNVCRSDAAGHTEQGHVHAREEGGAGEGAAC